MIYTLGAHIHHNFVGMDQLARQFLPCLWIVAVPFGLHHPFRHHCLLPATSIFSASSDLRIRLLRAVPVDTLVRGLRSEDSRGHLADNISAASGPITSGLSRRGRGCTSSAIWFILKPFRLDFCEFSGWGYFLFGPDL